MTYAKGFFTGNNKPPPSGPKAAADEHPDSVCAVCGASESYSRCGRCQKATYCGAECQEYDWWRHKKTCVPWDYRPVPALEQSTICPYCHREVKMKDLGLHMDSDCGKHLDVMLGRKPMPPLDGEAQLVRRDLHERVVRDGRQDGLARGRHVGARRAVHGHEVGRRELLDELALLGVEVEADGAARGLGLGVRLQVRRVVACV